MKKNILFFCFLSWACSIKAQIKLYEVIIATKNESEYKTQKNLKISDSIHHSSLPILGEILKNNTNLYFKEYGQGMLSTVSFRGTTAAHTSVIWNGININSPLNGSTDFNTIAVSTGQSVQVKSGGSSVLYGSGAIGGSVLLNSHLTFGDTSQLSLRTTIGSFDTYGGASYGSFSTSKISFNAGLSYLGSQNKYPYVGKFTWLGEQRYNQNGQYELADFNVAFGYKINSNNNIKLYSQSSYTDRNLALPTESDPRTKYYIQYNRNLIDYSSQLGRFLINPKFAFLRERYHYYPDKEKLQQYSFGEANTAIAKLNLNYKLKNGVLYSITEFNNTHGFGGSFGDNHREIWSQSISFNQQLAKVWNLEGGIKKEFTKTYKSPLLFSLGNTLDFDLYKVKLLMSKNFRMPTFNDLFWGNQGNPDLNPETSIQGEVIHELKFKKMNLSFSIFYNSISQMIRWVPDANGVWRPVNEAQVAILGSEIDLKSKIKFSKSYSLEYNGGYAYTRSVNQETKKQLTYTPLYKVNGGFTFFFKKNTALFFQGVYNGKVFTTSDNNEEYIIKPYLVLNGGTEISLHKNILLKAFINNITNLVYTSIDRPMPGRNFNFQLTYKIY